MQHAADGLRRLLERERIAIQADQGTKLLPQLRLTQSRKQRGLRSRDVGREARAAVRLVQRAVNESYCGFANLRPSPCHYPWGRHVAV